MASIYMDEEPSSPANVFFFPSEQSSDIFTRLEYRGNVYDILRDLVDQERVKRRCGSPVSENLHDLISSSLVPLTENVTNVPEYKSQATEFLGCFRDAKVEWDVNVQALPFAQRKAIYGLTNHAKRNDVDWRFQRFRFPYVHFEWHVQTRYSEVDDFIRQGVHDGETTIKFLWKAWTRNYAASALIAVGTCEDTLTLVALPNSQPPAVLQPATIAEPAAGAQPAAEIAAESVSDVQSTAAAPPLALVISRRSFVVTKVLQPELMKPVPYKAQHPPMTGPNDFAVFSTSLTVVQWLQSTQKWTTVLVALSALVTSLKPFVDKDHGAALGLSIIAIIAAAISILAHVIGPVLKWIEGNSARYRNH